MERASGARAESPPAAAQGCREAVAGAESGRGFKSLHLPLILFGIAFGQAEAAVVIYLRTIVAPVRARLGLPAGEPLPLFDPAQLGVDHRLLYIELAREAATLIMLAAVAWAVARNIRSWLAAYALAFGVWDLAFYFWLWAMIGWPGSLGTWDLLLLLPVPWAGPVAAPAIVALSLAVGGAIALSRAPQKVPGAAWALMLAGVAVLLVSFMWDWRHWVAGGAPRGFPWAVFGVGELLGIAGFSVGMNHKRSALSDQRSASEAVR
jgi:hypothetical protein